MKTLQELYAEVIQNDELKNEFLALTTEAEIVAFAEKYGCTATLDEIKTFFEEKANPAGKLSEEDMAQVAGGKSATGYEADLSITTVGIGCVVRAIASATGYKGRKCGTAIKGKGMLCGD